MLADMITVLVVRAAIACARWRPEYVLLGAGHRGSHAGAAALLLIFFLSCSTSVRAQTITLQTASGGVNIAGVNPSWSAALGNVNGLGVGSPAAGVAVISTGVAGGVLYTTRYNIVMNTGGNPGIISAYVSTNFGRSTLLRVLSCYPASGCGAASSYTAISSNPAAPTPVIPSPGVSTGTFTASLGVLVSNANGASVSTGSDTVTITLVTTRSDGSLRDTDTLAVTVNLQSAVQLQLATSPGGVTISAGSDYSLNFGNLNGLGINPASGLGVITSGVSGGVIYSSPYLVQPAFSSFSSTTGTVTIYVSTNFAHPTVLQLRDSADNSSFTAISTSSASQTNITSSASSSVNITRYLGVFVSNANGVGTFTGSDNAVLTYTLTVP